MGVHASTNPEFASILGDKRWNDKSSDNSLDAIEKDLAKTAEYLKRFEAVDTTGFPEQEQLNKTLMVRQLKEGLEGAKFKSWEMPVAQNYGIQIQAPQLVSYLPFDTVKDYEDYVTRLKNFPKQMEDTMDHMRRGMAAGLMPPRFLLEKVVPRAETSAQSDPEKSPFAQCLTKFPKTISAEDQKRIHDAVVAAIAILGAGVREVRQVRQGRICAEGLAPDVGLRSLPDGRRGTRSASRNPRPPT